MNKLVDTINKQVKDDALRDALLKVNNPKDIILYLQIIKESLRYASY